VHPQALQTPQILALTGGIFLTPGGLRRKTVS